MGSTEFLESLEHRTEDDPALAACMHYLRSVKNIADPAEIYLGSSPGDLPETAYHYFTQGITGVTAEQGFIPGVVEFFSSVKDGIVSRWVADFIADPEELLDMLGQDRVTLNADQKKTLARRAPDALFAGQTTKGVVASVKDHLGLFVKVRERTIGLVHWSNLPPLDVDEVPSEYYQVGDEVRVSVLRYNRNTNRLSLTMKGQQLPPKRGV